MIDDQTRLRKERQAGLSLFVIVFGYLRIRDRSFFDLYTTTAKVQQGGGVAGR